MNEVFYQVGIQIAAYLTVITLCFVAMNWFTNGFLIPSLRVRLSRGKFILVVCKSIGEDFYRVGKISNGFLIYKDKEKEEKRIAIKNSTSVSHLGATKYIVVNDEKNSILQADFSGISGFDAVKYNNLYLRALQAPDLQDKVIKIILVATVISAIASVVSLWLVYMQGVEISQIVTILNTNVGTNVI